MAINENPFIDPAMMHVLLMHLFTLLQEPFTFSVLVLTTVVTQGHMPTLSHSGRSRYVTGGVRTVGSVDLTSVGGP
jgi:hypothetical protein